jgi:hypothetical protein
VIAHRPLDAVREADIFLPFAPHPEMKLNCKLDKLLPDVIFLIYQDDPLNISLDLSA